MPGSAHSRNRCVGLLALVAFVFPVLPTAIAAQASYTEEDGVLPDGTLYRMRTPASWNGTLVRDLDYAGRADHPRYDYFLDQGFAVLGTQRHRLRAFQYDPAREIANINLVHDRFIARFGVPTRVIQYGCSGGGHVALAVAEHFPERVDGVVAGGAHTPVWLMNTFLDGWFVLKALIAPDLKIVDLPIAESGGTAHNLEGPLVLAWRAAIDRAQSTPEGRARIALAFTIGQWPAWVNTLYPQPDFDDVTALQHAMYHTAYQNARNPGGEARVLFESAAQGQQLSWNTGIDYAEFFENGNEFLKQAVRVLYEEAELDLDADLRRLDAFPRVEASPYALKYWGAPGRNVTGQPRIPVFRMHEIGDYQVPISIIQGYNDQISANGNDDMYRAAYVHAPGHCGFSPSETAAAVEVLMQRIETGSWGSTDPDQLNTLGDSRHDSGARFILLGDYAQRRYNRVWTP